MKKGIVYFVFVSLLLSTLAAFSVNAEVNTSERIDEVFEVTTYNNLEVLSNGDSHIEITYPEPGFLYLFQ